MAEPANIHEHVPADLSQEFFRTLVDAPGVRIQVIVSQGHASPEGSWYDQEMDEWVLLLEGAARLRFEGEEPIELVSGAYINIPAHKRHRVEWTSNVEPTVWLAVHYAGGTHKAMRG